jgi:cyclase
MNHRIIARLDIKGPNLVKGISMEGLRVLGKPEDFAEIYYESGADELMYVDVVASLFERNSLSDLISRTAKKVFIPLTVAGGLRNLEDIRLVLRCGADKVSLNTAAIRNPSIITEAVKEFGSSTIAVTIEAIKQPNGEYFAYVDNGREYTGVEVCQWARKAEALGAGELVITSVDHEGSGRGFDLALIKAISDLVSIPVIAHGGAGQKEHIMDAINIGGADAVAIASILHYECIRWMPSRSDYAEEGNIDFLKHNKHFNRIIPASLHEIKQFLNQHGVNCRLTD